MVFWVWFWFFWCFFCPCLQHIVHILDCGNKEGKWKTEKYFGKLNKLELGMFEQYVLVCVLALSLKVVEKNVSVLALCWLLSYKLLLFLILYKKR